MKNLAIFYGGKSAEHDISILTAIQVMKNLDVKKYKLFPIYINQNNEWSILEDYLNLNIYANKNFKGKKIVNGFFEKNIIYKSKFGFKKLECIDIAINCMHGLNGEDGTLSGLLELNNIPYVGSGVIASGIGMDKVLQKDIFVANDIPCAKYTQIYEQQFINNKEECLEDIEKNIKYPMVIKPANLGSSIGINISKNREELVKNIEIALNFDKKVIIEEKIQNLREINCSVMGNYENIECSILEEPKGWETFLDFDEKYIKNNKDGNKKQIDVTLGDGLDEQIKELSKKVFKILGASGITRIDFLLDDKKKKVYVNEINIIPGSYANYLWKHKYTFSNLLEQLINICEKEYLYKQKNKYAYSSNVLLTNSSVKRSKLVK